MPWLGPPPLCLAHKDEPRQAAAEWDAAWRDHPRVWVTPPEKPEDPQQVALDFNHALD